MSDPLVEPAAPPAPPAGSRTAALAGTAAASAIILGSGFITGLIGARVLGPTGRGELAAITVWAATLLYAGTLGLPEAVAYFAAAERTARTQVWVAGQFGAALLGVLVTVAGWWLIPAFFSDQPVLSEWIRWYLVFYGVPCLASLCACAWLQGAGRLKAFNLCRLTVHVVNAAGFLLLLVIGDRSVPHFAAVLLVGNASTWLLATALGPSGSSMTPPPASLARRLVGYGLRVQVGNWSNAANVRLNQLFLSLFTPAGALGLYVVAVSYASVLLAIPQSAALVMLPDIVAQHRDGDIRASVQVWYRRMMWLTGVAGIGLALASLVAVPLLFGSAFRDTVPLVALLVPATMIMGMSDVLSTAFRGAGRPDISTRSELVGLAVTVAALAVLLPAYGLYGAAVASLLAYASRHLYLTRRAVTVFGVDVRALYVPTRDDAAALRRTVVAARERIRRLAGQRVSTQEL